VYTSLVDTLNQPTIGTKGTFTYLWTGDIMSYVILELTGLSPKQFLVQKVLPSLGIDSSEITWELNLGGVEQGSTGMRTNAEQMAKFGQLYLQGGMASESKRIFSQGWLEQSWTTYFVTGAGFPYGYLWYGMPGSDTHCAFGIGGQDICISPTMDRVVVQQADPNPLNLTESSGIISTVALNPLLSFEAPTSAPTKRPTSSPAGSKASKGIKSSKTS
jgi:CubicO group peptidase (beta-lactamase class C family)